MSLSFTICPDNRNTRNSVILYFVVAVKEIDKYGGSKDGEDQPEHCLGRSTGITQHNNNVNVRKSRELSKMDVVFGYYLQ